MEALSPEVIDELRHGKAPRERKLAVASTGAHLSPADRAEILAVLSHDADEAISVRASESLLSLPIGSFLEAIGRESTVPALHQYAAANLAEKPEVVEALLKSKSCPGDVLTPLVPRLTVPQVQLLLEDLDRLTSSPHLIRALEQSSNVTAEQKNLLQDLHTTGIDEKALADAAAEAEPDAAKRMTLLQQIGRMTVAQRVQMAIKGSGEARRTLIRDTNKVVQRAVLQSPRLTDQDVESFAAMTTLTDEILRLIANNRNFRKNYTVVRNLMNNSKTPLDVSLHMLVMLNAVDLKKLSLSKNVPETLRTSAAKLIRTRADQRK